MRLPLSLTALPVLICLSLLTSCTQTPQQQYENWPVLSPATGFDQQQETQINAILERLSLEQKVAQMIQADIGSVTPEEIEQYRIGSVLNGGGQTPFNNRQATAQQWVDLADALYRASMNPGEGITPIPIIWGTDAVHGHGNVRGATLFPHNIGLGATRNTRLVEEIAAATALEMAATGLDWNFAPTVAVALDDRWGRTYESFSENPDLVAELGAAAVRGLQGEVDSPSFLDERHVVATAKHFIGDGGTRYGDDQGFVVGEEAALLETHLPGYITALKAGVQTVMASYSWWNGVHSHANARLMNGLLKDQLGFDGVIVSDWQAIAHVPGCSIDSCPEAINAGVDLFMIPNAPDWKQFYRNTLQQVRSGEVPLARIDDAVRRILRVKMRAGLWSKPSPDNRMLAGQQRLIGAPSHRSLARQAVRESLVLLKNNGVLPIAGDARVVVTGPGANDLAMQSGGWSVTWQGTDVSNEDFPGATSIRGGIQAALNTFGGTLISAKDEQSAKPDVAIVVFGETPYAELSGDIENLSTLEVEQDDKTGLKLIKQFKQRNIPVVAVLLSGRPLWVNKELNAADAFVAAWLPGSEGQGIADVLIGDQAGNARHDFQGRLSFSWPSHPCDAGSQTDGPIASLFDFGYGLDYQQRAAWTPLQESTQAWRYGCLLGDRLPAAEDHFFSPSTGWQFYAEKKTNAHQAVDGNITFGPVTAELLATGEYGVHVTWDGSRLGRIVLRNEQPDNHFLPLLANDGTLTFDVKVHTPPDQDISLITFSGLSAATHLDLRPLIDAMPQNQWQTVRVSLACLANDRLDFNKVGVPFGLQSSGQLELSIANVKYEADRVQPLDIECAYQY